MAVRVRYKVTVSISSTTAEEKDLANQTYEIANDALGEGGTVKYKVIAGATDLPIQFGQVASVKFLLIRTQAKDPTQNPVALTFKKNSNVGEAIVVAPLATEAEGHMLLSTDGITSLYVSNAGAVDMEVTLIMAGD